LQTHFVKLILNKCLNMFTLYLSRNNVGIASMNSNSWCSLDRGTVKLTNDTFINTSWQHLLTFWLNDEWLYWRTPYWVLEWLKNKWNCFYYSNFNLFFIFTYQLIQKYASVKVTFSRSYKTFFFVFRFFLLSWVLVKYRNNNW